MKNVICLGIDKVKIINGTVKGKTINIENYVSSQLPEGVMGKEGMIEDMGTAIEHVSDLLLRSNIKGKKFTLCLEAEEAAFREVAVPKLKKSNLVPLILNEFNETLDDEDKYIVDYIFPKEPEKDGAISTLVFALHTEMIAHYLDFFKSLGIQCECIDLATNAMGKLSSHEAGTESGAWCVLQVEDEMCKLHLVDNGYTRFSKSMPYDMIARGEEDSLEQDVISLKELFEEASEFQEERNPDHYIQGVYLLGEYNRLPEVRELIIDIYDIPCKIIGESGKISGDSNFFPYEYGTAIGGLIRRG